MATICFCFTRPPAGYPDRGATGAIIGGVPVRMPQHNLVPYPPFQPDETTMPSPRPIPAFPSAPRNPYPGADGDSRIGAFAQAESELIR